MFKRVSIQLDNNKELTIETLNNTPKSKYVQSISLNNEPINNCWIDRSKLLNGGVLQFEMDSIPNKKWGVGTPPPSMSTIK